MLRISEVAQMLGISSQSIRNYEKIENYPTKRTSGTGYREYDRYNLIELATLRGYQNAGFSLQQSFDTLNITHIPEKTFLINNQIQELERHIHFLQRTLIKLHDQVYGLSAIDFLSNTFRIEQSPEIYYMPFFSNPVENDETFPETVDHMKHWTKLFPVAQFINIFNKDSFLSSDRSFLLGTAISAHDISMLPKDTQMLATYYPSRKCLHKIIDGMGKIHSYIDSLESICNALIDQGYVINATPIGLCFCVEDFPNTRHYYTHLWIPVE